MRVYFEAYSDADEHNDLCIAFRIRQSYFEQAPLLSAMLSIKLANRTWGGRPVAMAGFPLSQLEKYLKVLVEDNCKLVAICEEFRSDDQGGEQPSPLDWKTINSTRLLNEKVDIVRRVTRVVSPGTLIDEKWLNPLRNNFILSISSEEDGKHYGLAWLDLSTSDFHVSACRDVESLRDELKRISPSEVVLEASFAGDKDSTSSLFAALELDRVLLTYIDSVEESISHPAALPSSEADASHSYSAIERRAITNLTRHLRTRLLSIERGNADTDVDDLIASGLVKHHIPEETMAIDSSTLDALEVREATREGGVRGSLVSTVRRTLTKGGSRLLVEWLTAPSTSLDVILHRHSIVEHLYDHQFLQEDLRSLLRRIQRGDVSRTLQKIATGRNDEQDLLEIRDFVKTTNDLKKLIQQDSTGSQAINSSAALNTLIEQLTDLSSLGDLLEGAIDERVLEQRLRAMEALAREDEGSEVDDVPTTASPSSPVAEGNGSTTAGWGVAFEHLIRPSSSTQLFSLTREYDKLRQDAATLQTSLEQRHPQGKLTLRFLMGQGFVVHLSELRSPTTSFAEGQDPEEIMTLAYRTKSTRSYYYDKWSQLGARLVRLQDELKRAEMVELRRLRGLVLQHSHALRSNARLVDELDCLLGFAQLAMEMQLVRPEMGAQSGDEVVFDVEAGRHIGVELGLLDRGRTFTTNDVSMATDSRLHFITGPNMGGKSTFLRQNAIIAILAQAGSFVPARSARLSTVDRLFSRVGAKDDLFRDRSTFMVEMMETSEILRRATRKSFVIADEIGRGTTTNVGVALAFATLDHLSKLGCRALFATHLHELADRMGYDPATQKADSSYGHVRFSHTDVLETKESITYLHTLKPGVNRESHGLTVAKLAGMPEEALTVARNVLEELSARQEDQEDSGRSV